ncbi:PTS sugar transporter subunit IIA [Niveibacterium umoris]|uniref:PTS system nitrogen regulatory IIA component n=2 Tax=Niveibacterium umoris TaxID=1193620 RepID=A0A840BG28_9RHOO|nr:PTS sugar transporter subunit IIA [Niveibacterium umoris]MBB4011623.1 PTS system nitrogen regulatory IIA component [Niveibacterium umoris]
MNADHPLLEPDDVLIDLHVTTRHALLEEIARHMARRHCLPRDRIAESLAAREQLGSTGLGYCVAIPHARMAEAKRPVAVFARPQIPLAFDAPDSKPVSDFLALIVPSDSPQQHLELLSSIATHFGERSFRESLRSAADAASVARCFAPIRVHD